MIYFVPIFTWNSPSPGLTNPWHQMGHHGPCSEYALGRLKTALQPHPKMFSSLGKPLSKTSLTALERDCFSLMSSAKFWASARELILEVNEIILQCSLPGSTDSPCIFRIYCCLLFVLYHARPPEEWGEKGGRIFFLKPQSFWMTLVEAENTSPWVKNLSLISLLPYIKFLCPENPVPHTVVLSGCLYQGRRMEHAKGLYPKILLVIIW